MSANYLHFHGRDMQRTGQESSIAPTPELSRGRHANPIKDMHTRYTGANERLSDEFMSSTLASSFVQTPITSNVSAYSYSKSPSSQDLYVRPAYSNYSISELSDVQVAQPPPAQLVSFDRDTKLQHSLQTKAYLPAQDKCADGAICILKAKEVALRTQQILSKMKAITRKSVSSHDTCLSSNSPSGGYVANSTGTMTIDNRQLRCATECDKQRNLSLVRPIHDVFSMKTKCDRANILAEKYLARPQSLKIGKKKSELQYLQVPEGSADSAATVNDNDHHLHHDRVKVQAHDAHDAVPLAIDRQNCDPVVETLLKSIGFYFELSHINEPKLGAQHATAAAEAQPIEITKMTDSHVQLTTIKQKSDIRERPVLQKGKKCTLPDPTFETQTAQQLRHEGMPYSEDCSKSQERQTKKKSCLNKQSRSKKHRDSRKRFTQSKEKKSIPGHAARALPTKKLREDLSQICDNSTNSKEPKRRLESLSGSFYKDGPERFKRKSEKRITIDPATETIPAKKLRNDLSQNSDVKDRNSQMSQHKVENLSSISNKRKDDYVRKSETITSAKVQSNAGSNILSVSMHAVDMPAADMPADKDKSDKSYETSRDGISRISDRHGKDSERDHVETNNNGEVRRVILNPPKGPSLICAVKNNYRKVTVSRWVEEEKKKENSTESLSNMIHRLKLKKEDLKQLQKEEFELMCGCISLDDPAVIRNVALQSDIKKQMIPLIQFCRDGIENEEQHNERVTSVVEPHDHHAVETKSRPGERLRADGASAAHKAETEARKAESEARRAESKRLKVYNQFRVKKMKVSCVYKDGGDYWCKPCNCVSRTLDEHLTHLHSGTHWQHANVYELSESSKTKSLPRNSHRDQVATPMKGVEFLRPNQGFYCTMCEEDINKASHVERHLINDLHNTKYRDYIDKNPNHEHSYNLGKTLGLCMKITPVKDSAVTTHSRTDSEIQKSNLKNTVETSSVVCLSAPAIIPELVVEPAAAQAKKTLQLQWTNSAKDRADAHGAQISEVSKYNRDNNSHTDLMRPTWSHTHEHSHEPAAKDVLNKKKALPLIGKLPHLRISRDPRKSETANGVENVDIVEERPKSPRLIDILVAAAAAGEYSVDECDDVMSDQVECRVGCEETLASASKQTVTSETTGETEASGIYKHNEVSGTCKEIQVSEILKSTRMANETLNETEAYDFPKRTEARDYCVLTESGGTSKRIEATDTCKRTEFSETSIDARDHCRHMESSDTSNRIEARDSSMQIKSHDISTKQTFDTRGTSKRSVSRSESNATDEGIDTCSTSKQFESSQALKRINAGDSSGHIESNETSEYIETRDSSKQTEFNETLKHTDARDHSTQTKSIDTFELELALARFYARDSLKQTKSSEARKHNARDTSELIESNETSKRIDSRDTSKPAESSVTSKRLETKDASKTTKSSETSKRTDSRDTSKQTESAETSKRKDTKDISKPTESSVTCKRIETKDASKTSESSGTLKRTDSRETSKTIKSSDSLKRIDSRDTSKRTEIWSEFCETDKRINAKDSSKQLGSSKTSKQTEVSAEVHTCVSISVGMSPVLSDKTCNEPLSQVFAASRHESEAASAVTESYPVKVKEEIISEASNKECEKVLLADRNTKHSAGSITLSQLVGSIEPKENNLTDCRRPTESQQAACTGEVKQHDHSANEDCSKMIIKIKIEPNVEVADDDKKNRCEHSTIEEDNKMLVIIKTEPKFELADDDKTLIKLEGGQAKIVQFTNNEKHDAVGNVSVVEDNSNTLAEDSCNIS